MGGIYKQHLYIRSISIFLHSCGLVLGAPLSTSHPTILFIKLWLGENQQILSRTYWTKALLKLSGWKIFFLLFYSLIGLINLVWKYLKVEAAFYKFMFLHIFHSLGDVFWAGNMEHGRSYGYLTWQVNLSTPYFPFGHLLGVRWYEGKMWHLLGVSLTLQDDTTKPASCDWAAIDTCYQQNYINNELWQGTGQLGRVAGCSVLG